MDLNNEAAKIMGYEFENLVAWVPTSKKHLKQFPIYPWNPLEDLNQCFEVVEKLRKGGWFLNMSNEMTNKYWAEFWKDGYYKGHQVYAKTLNEAILKAALEAVKQ